MKQLYCIVFCLFSQQVFAQNTTTQVLEVENTNIAALAGNVQLLTYQGQESAFFNGSTSAEKITYTFNLSDNAETNFNLKINYLIPTTGFGNKKQFVKVNGTTLGEYDFEVSNNLYVDKEIGQITLQTGTNTIEIQASWGYMYVNAMALRGNFGSGLLIGGNRQILQVENPNVATLAGNTTIEALRGQSTAYFAGNTNAEKMTVKLNLAQATTLELKINYAITDGTAIKLQSVKVNQNEAVQVGFANSYGLLMDKNTGEISFPAGDNTIEIQAIDGGMYINYVSVSPKPANPPATTCGTAPANVAGSFYVAGGKIYDNNCNVFVMRGINLQFGDQINFNRLNALGAIPKIRTLTRSNALRVLLRFDPAENNTTQAKDVRAATDSCIQYKMMPVLMMYSNVGTGGQNVSQLKDAVNRWVELASEAEGNLDTYENFKKYGVLNILNEFGSNNLPNYAAWKNAYKEAITLIRMAGYTNPIMIDAHGYGQLLEVFTGSDGGGKSRAQELLEHDPLKNVIFSVHAYYNTWGTDTNITNQVNTMANSGLAFIFGEHGNQQLNPPINHKTIWDRCESANPKIGWLTWSWYGNGGEATVLNMTNGWLPNSLDDFTTFGKEVVNHSKGLLQTSRIATVFGEDDPLPTAIEFESGEVKIVNAFPNPYTDSFWLKIDLRSRQNIAIQVLDAYNQVCAVINPTILNAGEQNLKIDTPYLKQGLYVLRLQVGKQLIIMKMIKYN
jgi:mannan endo-1,4-beta-mannosidase